MVVHCEAVWDGYDIPVDALMQEMKAEFAGQIAFFALDVDEEANWDFLQSAPVMNVPCLVYLKNGGVFRVRIGQYSKAKTREILREWLKTSGQAAD